MIDGCHSFLGEIVADVGNELKIVDAALVRELVLDYSDLLGGEEYSRCIEEEVEGMFGDASFFFWVILGDLGIEMK